MSSHRIAVVRRRIIVACVSLCLGGAGAAVASDAPVVVPGAPNLTLPPPAPDSDPTPPPVASPPPETQGGGDAEPAPLSPGSEAPRSRSGAPVISDTLPRSGRHRVAFGLRFAYRLGDAGQAISPPAGYGIAGSYGFTYARVAEVLDLSAGVDFSSDRFAAGEQGVTATGPYDSTRVLSENDFILAQTFALAAGPVRPFVVLGVGLGLGSFESVAPQYRGQETDTHFLGRGALGLDIVVAPAWSVCLRGNYTAVRRAAPYVTNAGQTLPLFGDLLDIDVQAVYRF